MHTRGERRWLFFILFVFYFLGSSVLSKNETISLGEIMASDYGAYILSYDTNGLRVLRSVFGSGDFGCNGHRTQDLRNGGQHEEVSDTSKKRLRKMPRKEEEGRETEREHPHILFLAFTPHIFRRALNHTNYLLLSIFPPVHYLCFASLFSSISYAPSSSSASVDNLPTYLP